jgi:small-conductance mechanosensitive channel
MSEYINFLNTNWFMLILEAFVLLSQLLFTGIGKLTHKADNRYIQLGKIIFQQGWLAAVLGLGIFCIQKISYFLITSHLHRLAITTVMLEAVLDFAQALLGLWLVYSIYRACIIWLQQSAEANYQNFPLMLPYLKSALKVSCVFIFVVLLVPDLLLPLFGHFATNKLITVLFILWLTGVLLQSLSATQKILLHHYSSQLSNNYKARRAYTQFNIFYKVAVLILILLSAAGILMVFESVREFGMSILASAGVATVAAAFAAQKTLGNLFMGLQLALTQPIKINDAIIIENESGTVEEITLTYVIIKLWDLRRLVVPINYFLERPFQNWTVKTASLICTVLLYVDYSMPIAPLRKYYLDWLSKSPLWDKQTSNLQVTDASNDVIQIRALASASNAGDAWNLRCEIREELINFICQNYPQCLPQNRVRCHGINADTFSISSKT